MGKPEPSEADERLKMVKTQLADTQPIGSGTLFLNLRHLELTNFQKKSRICSKNTRKT